MDLPISQIEPASLQYPIVYEGPEAWIDPLYVTLLINKIVKSVLDGRESRPNPARRQ
jgi:hypothetical protein